MAPLTPSPQYDRHVNLVASSEAETPAGVFSDDGHIQVMSAANLELLDTLTQCEQTPSRGDNNYSHAIAQASLFTGEDERFASERAISRLTEMTTPEYAQLKWRPNASDDVE